VSTTQRRYSARCRALSQRQLWSSFIARGTNKAIYGIFWSSASALPVVIVANGERLQIGIVYIGEPSQHLTLAINGIGELVNDPSRHYGNRTIDLLFHSVAPHAGPRAIGVILSGTLDDGSRGLAAIHKAGGITMVLTPSSSPEHDMPSNAIDFDGPVDLIGSTTSIAQGISEACAMQIF
jgi:two-component system, chemotaxis family, protein-glutamate methylesterase/glutaminase